MPNTEEIRKQIVRLARYGGNGLPQEYGEYLLSLSKLSDCMEKYSQVDDNGAYKPLGKRGIQEMRNAYDAVFQAQKNHDIAMNELGAENDAILAERKHIMTEIGNLLGKDYTALSGSLEGKENLPEILDNARGIHLDITGQQLSSSGAKMSSRLPVSYTDASGKEIKGFFTETSNFEPTKEVNKLFDEASEGHPEFQQIFRRIYNSQLFRQNLNSIKNLDEAVYKPLREKKLNHAYDQYIEALKPVRPAGTSQEVLEKDQQENDALKAKLTQDDTFGRRFMNFAKNYCQLQNKYGVLRNNAGIENYNAMEERNAAMSVVADMLGVSQVIARSTKMQLTQDGKTKQGVFMQYAEGCDVENITEGSPMTRLSGVIVGEKNSMDNPEAFDSVANLQVEDYICGNVDRHQSNMFYKFEETPEGPKFTGVVGIDNDCSLGSIRPARDFAHAQLPSLDNMMVLGEKTANKIMNMTPDMLKITLQNFNISDKERTAAGNRLLDLQTKLAEDKQYFQEHPNEKLKEGRIRIVKDEEWKNYTLDELSHRPGYEAETDIFQKRNYRYKNYFATVSYIPLIAYLDKRTKEAQERDREQMERMNPQLKEEPKPKNKMAHGVLMTENNALGIDSNNRSLKRLSAQMAEVNKGWFISSSEFRDVMRQTKLVQKLSEAAKPDMSYKKLQKLKEAYDKLAEKTNAYLKKKEIEQIGLDGKRVPLSGTSKKRVDFAEELKRFTEDRQNGLTDAMNAKQRETEAMLLDAENMARSAKEIMCGMKTEQLQNSGIREYASIIGLNYLLKLEKASKPDPAQRPIAEIVQEFGFSGAVNRLSKSETVQNMVKQFTSSEKVQEFFNNRGEAKLANSLKEGMLQALKKKPAAPAKKTPEKVKTADKGAALV